MDAKSPIEDVRTIFHDVLLFDNMRGRHHCPFCHNKDIKERVIASNKLSFAFPTNMPIVPGHVLVCPKRCVASFSELSGDELKSIFDLADCVKAAARSVFGAEGFNHAWNEGEIAGQTVSHFHLHIVPRNKDDAGITNYEPRKFLYRPGSRAKRHQKELKLVASDLQTALNRLQQHQAS